MEYQCTDARFGFWDGNTKYTVHYSYGIATWFVFRGEETSSALWSKKINPRKSKSPNRAVADDILVEYLESIEVVKS